jgi:hypothetical protein
MALCMLIKHMDNFIFTMALNLDLHGFIRDQTVLQS